MKTYTSILAEQDIDYEYKLCSVENIHTPEVLEQIRLALGRHGLINMEPVGVQKTINTESPFMSYPFMTVYVVKLTMSSPLGSNEAVQSVSLFTRIKDDRIKLFDKDDKIVMDGPTSDQDEPPVEVDSDTAQSEVGDERAQVVVSDLMKELDAINTAKKIEIDVYEFVLSNAEVSDMLDRPVERGFYVCEKYSDGSGKITGPFTKCPDNYQYGANIKSASLIEATVENNLIEYEVNFNEPDMQEDPLDAVRPDVTTKQSVTVVDQDTGKEYTAVVNAASEDSARIIAVDSISKKTGLSRERFIPKGPKIKR